MTDLPTIQQALSAVMGSVQGIAKRDRNSQQNYSFRGIDAVMSAVGPALREHGVVCVPNAESIEFHDYTTRNGAIMRNAVVKVRFVFYGPAGDSIECCTYGEAADAGDKAVSKAHSVAYRTALLQALTIPTDEPDPDSDSHQRASSGPAPATSVPTGAGAGPSPSLQPNAVALTEAVRARGLTSDQKIQFRAALMKAKLPQSITDMDEAQAFDALAVLDHVFPEEATG